MDNIEQRKLYIKYAPVIIAASLCFILIAKLLFKIEISWLVILISTIAGLVTGFGIALRLLYGNKLPILALYIAGLASIYLAYTSYLKLENWGLLLILTSTFVGLYIPQIAFKNKLLAKLNSGI